MLFLCQQSQLQKSLLCWNLTNESYANFLARLEATISHTVIREETKK